MLRLIAICILAFLAIEGSAQDRKGPFRIKRKKVEVPNYTLFLQLHEVALEYSTKIESKVDSLLKARNTSTGGNIFDFRIRTIQSIQHVLYRSDPVIGFLDSWTFGAQMVDFLQTPEAREYLGYGHPVFRDIFDDFLQEFYDSYDFLYDDTDEMSARIRQFASKHPITGPYLNRTSVVDATAQWVGEASIGFKSGVATLTDALRNISDRLNYYTEFTPKVVEWNVEKSVGDLIGTDSLGPILESSIASLERISHAVDSIDRLLYAVTDTVLTDVDRQRWETLHFISSERKAVLAHLSTEREVLVDQLIQERLAVESLIQREREASLDQFQQIINETMVYSFDRVDSLVNRIFFRIIILAAILALGMVLAVVVYKKM